MIHVTLCFACAHAERWPFNCLVCQRRCCSQSVLALGSSAEAVCAVIIDASSMTPCRQLSQFVDNIVSPICYCMCAQTALPDSPAANSLVQGLLEIGHVCISNSTSVAQAKYVVTRPHGCSLRPLRLESTTAVDMTLLTSRQVRLLRRRLLLLLCDFS